MNAVRQPTTPKVDTTPVVEPIFVFGCGMSDPYKDGTAAVAARYYGAMPGVPEGLNGNAYAIPFRSADGGLISARKMADHVNQFLKYARANPDQRFRVGRIGCARDGFSDRDIAPMFRAAPNNCTLPAIWRRELGVVDTARVLVYDPFIRLTNELWRAQLKNYLSLNMPLWGVSKCELLSIGTSRGVSVAALTAKQLGFPHREIRANPRYYGDLADAASELLGIWCATHLINVTNPNQTVLPGHTRILHVALRDGVNVDDLNINEFD
jgi:hypothetical protein